MTQRHGTLQLQSEITRIVFYRKMTAFPNTILRNTRRLKTAESQPDPLHIGVYCWDTRSLRIHVCACMTLLCAHIQPLLVVYWPRACIFSTPYIMFYLMASTHLKLDVNPRLILWIVDFLVNHSQTVRHQAALSSSRSISTGSPQGTVLSPILFTLYTNAIQMTACTGNDTTPIIKYSEDSAVEDLSNSDSVYFAEVKSFNNWCRDNSLDLNVKKTKEMLIHFRKAPTVILTLACCHADSF